MRDKWYGDNRDIVKWSSILKTAVDNEILNILHVAYYQKSPPVQVEIGGNRFELQKEIWKHFRDIDNIRRIKKVNGKTINIEVILDQFKERNEYLSNVLNRIKRNTKPFICFLDPDTGLEPPKSINLNHVLNNELSEVWKVLPNKSILIFYQHRNRNKDWIDEKKEQFATCIKRPTDSVDVTKSSIANDVVLFIATK